MHVIKKAASCAKNEQSCDYVASEMMIIRTSNFLCDYVMQWDFFFYCYCKLAKAKEILLLCH